MFIRLYLLLVFWRLCPGFVGKGHIMCLWWRQITWAVLLPTTTHIQSFAPVDHTELWIFAFFVISQPEQICKWGIKYVNYAHSVTTDHVGSTMCKLNTAGMIKMRNNKSICERVRILNLMKGNIWQVNWQKNIWKDYDVQSTQKMTAEILVVKLRLWCRTV